MSVNNSGTISGESFRSSPRESVCFKDEKRGSENLNKTLSEKITLIPYPSYSKTQSKLTLARDSVILLLSSQRVSSLSVAKCQDNISKSSAEKSLKNNSSSNSNTNCDIVSQQSLDKNQKRNSSKLLTATDSYEIIKTAVAGTLNSKEKSRKTKLNFSTKLEVGGKGASSDSPRKKKPSTYTKNSKPRPIMKKQAVPSYRQDGFTDDRIINLVNMMKESPSLIRLFTPCIK